MSVQALAASFALEIESPTVKLVLLGLANYCDQKGRCWPSQREIAGLTSLSERAVRDALNVLVADGWVSREIRRRADGSRSTDVFTLLFLQPANPADCFRNEPETQPASAAGGGAGRAGGGAPAAGPTTFEPSKNLSTVANAPVEASKPAKRRASMVPEQWAPTNADLGIGVAEGFTPGEIERELAKFRDHEFRTPRSDWSKAFRNWLRTAATDPRRPRNERPDQPSPKLAAKQANMERAFRGAEIAVARRAF